MLWQTCSPLSCFPLSCFPLAGNLCCSCVPERGKARWVPLQRGVWQGGALCGPEMSEGKRGWACQVGVAGVEVRFASWR